MAYRRQKKMKLNHKGPAPVKNLRKPRKLSGGTSGQLEEFFPLI